MSLPNPIVLLDARARYVHPAFQMTRASTKTVFDSTGKLATVPVNALGWDHDPATGQARGYLSEPSATNLFLHSNDLTQGAWTKIGATITPNAITGPDGNGMAKLVEDSANGIHLARQTITIADGATIVTQAVAKAEERSTMQIFVYNSVSAGNNVLANFNLNDGTVTGDREANDGELVGHGISDLGGGFYRTWLAARIGAGATSFVADFRMIDGNGDSTYQGDGTSGLYLGYRQASVGSYPTSYIETGAATATRAEDSLVLSNLGNFPWWHSERGTVVLDVRLPGAPVGDAIFGLGQQILLRLQTSGVRLDGSILSNTSLLPYQNMPGRHVIAVSWDNDNGFGASADGGNVVSGDFQGDVTATSIGLGKRGVSGGVSAALCQIHRAVYYPQRPSNADLQSLTAIQE